jgi:hypothetical protein
VTIGIVGYSPVLDRYPLGPRLMEGLVKLSREVESAERGRVNVENMTWGPIHIVQQFQDSHAQRPSKIILVGAASVCTRPGRVRSYRWAGGHLSDEAMQARMYEAVTGIVDIENTLIIGSHFDIWPAETFAVEVELAADLFGRMVVADSTGQSNNTQLRNLIGFSPDRAIARLVAVIAKIAAQSAGTITRTKSAASLAPIKAFLHNEIVALPRH